MTGRSAVLTQAEAEAGTQQPGCS